jgi:hypothetical protein
MDTTPKPHRLLVRMERATRLELEDDLRRFGAELEGLKAEEVADRIPSGRTPNGHVSKRAERLHAWFSRHGLRSPNEPEPDSEPPATPGSALTDDDLSITRWSTDEERAAGGFSVVGLDGDQEEPIEAVLARGEKAFAERARRMRALNVPRRLRLPPGPYAIAHFGDDHLDDDGCDLAAYRAAIRIVATTPHFYGGAVGDLLNNWPDGGRLAALHGQQHATVDDGWRLARWSMHACRWIYRVLGNHDLWGRGGTILRLLAEGAQIGLMAPDEVRLELESPGVERPLRIHVRHDFRGNSMWNPAHGPMRAAKLDPWADVYVAGHRHEWVTHCEEGPDHAVRWALRARGFKFHDSYARGLGHFEQQHGAVVSTVVDPTHPHPFERVRIHLDVEEAAEHLGWLRRRRS